ncbi:hypothetical protein COJ85_28245 [Bacillus sp. AFS076308]|uniref:N-acyl homoserine lactonase family protein n=1 Tax=unclassified Bacillus (in: firmicutes) TaxID=185979 RepID=UPI000BF6B5FF|nr:MULTISPECIES: N-acyl homoserine lactonase family protein [unclassified Bacillus (in: firmicutes)]PFN82739.1 hypothetical protein COJ85_28245 [Bacillus sp. AFS076308]PGV50238.1 hypothetical protein COD92_19105 [Bacillus sp. AFS037270]
MYTVNILNNGEWVAPGTVIYLHAFGRHDPVKIVQNFYLVRGRGHTILIDTGIDNLEDYLTEEQERSFVSAPSRTTEELLRDAGVALEDVDMLILTHLHFDHYINARLFPNARIIINRREWHYNLSPENKRYAPQVGFPREVFGWLVDEAWERLQLVEGEAEVLPGIRVIWTGGHSPGHQIVTVETTQGTVIIPGDEIYMYENLEANIPIGYYYSFENVVAAMDLIRGMEAIVLPAHDPKVHERYPSLQIGNQRVP